MRAIDQVIDQMVNHVPLTETFLIERLNWLKKDAGYKAPEMQGECWDNLAGFVNAVIPYPPTEDWHKQVVAVFTDTKVQP